MYQRPRTNREFVKTITVVFLSGLSVGFTIGYILSYYFER